ncbi:MAG: transposase [Dehalococcoidia bacterium]|jgi:REP element-mobilizing transposase RayT
MRFDLDKYHRRSIRLPGYDYSSPGAYFLTICTQERNCILGEIVEGEVKPSRAGQMIETVWRQLPDFYDGVQLDAFAIMPNHIHGIILLVGAGPRACPGPRQESGQPQGVAPTKPLSLPNAMHRFKSLTTTKYLRGVRDGEWPALPGRLWQRNYYEHIIRNEVELAEVRGYIVENAARWVEDQENPQAREVSKPHPR